MKVKVGEGSVETGYFRGFLPRNIKLLKVTVVVDEC